MMFWPLGKPVQEVPSDPDAWGKFLLGAAYRRNTDQIRQALKEGANIDCVDPETGLSALHIAVGHNDFALCCFLIEECGAKFFPDHFGRWPTLVAAECRVSDHLGEYIARKEAAYLAPKPRLTNI